MSTFTSRSIAVAIAVSLFAATVSAQPRAGHPMGAPRYDKSTEVTIGGTVEAVLPQQARMPMMGSGTHLTLAADAGKYDVHVGPAWWLADNKIEFKAGDRIQVVGSSVTFNDGKALIAREITIGDRKITLRDANGVPVWSGRGRRTQS